MNLSTSPRSEKYYDHTHLSIHDQLQLCFLEKKTSKACLYTHLVKDHQVHFRSLEHDWLYSRKLFSNNEFIFSSLLLFHGENILFDTWV